VIATASARLLRAILADPADDTARLAYSDALEEEGQDRLANFVRRQMVGEPVTPALMALIPFEGILECQPHQTVRVAEARQATVTAPSGAALVWRRGFVVEVSCTAADFVEHAAALFSAHPVERVTLTDKRPCRAGMTDMPEWTWFVEDVASDPIDEPIEARLPGCLFDMLDRRDAFSWSRPLVSWVPYRTRQSALDALSRACVAYGRRLAGLPALD